MKITPDHLERGAFIYIRQSTADQLANNHESRRILAARVRVSADRASSGCLQRSVKAALVPCSPSRRRVWRATGATGTR